MIVKKGNVWILYSKGHSGPRGGHRVLGRHPTKAAALAQERAIQASTRKRRKNPGAPGYRALHWGRGGEGFSHASVPDPARDNPDGLVLIGELSVVEYITRKGFDPAEGVEYVHEFEGRLPKLYVGRNDGRLYVVGGTYRVSAHGIIG